MRGSRLLEIFADPGQLGYRFEPKYYFKTSRLLINRFVFCCILPHILYCSPVVFCGLLSKDWKIISSCLKLTATCSRISLTRLQEFVISKHLSSCEVFASKILSDAQHPLHSFLSNSRLPRPSRSSFKHIFARTNAYKNSVIPYLARFLTKKVLTNYGAVFKNPSWLLSSQGNSGFPHLQLQIFPLFFEKVPLLPIPTLFVIPPRFKSPGSYLPWKLSNSVLPSVQSPGKRYQTGHYCGHTSHKCIFTHSWQTISSLSFIHSFIFIHLFIYLLTRPRMALNKIKGTNNALTTSNYGSTKRQLPVTNEGTQCDTCDEWFHSRCSKLANCTRTISF